MTHPAPIDVSKFQLYPAILGEDDDDTALLKDMAKEALRFLPGLEGAPPAERLYLAFGVGGLVAVFLAELTGPLHDRPDTQIWIVVGDLPEAFIGIACRNPVMVLQSYCELMDDWADRVLGRKDMSVAYLIHAEPTPRHARMLKDRIKLIRRDIIPEARSNPVWN